MTPLLARLSGRYTHVTLHHLMDTVELKDAGVRHEGLYRFAGAAATRMLLLSNSVSVLMPGYRKILNDKYGRDNVHLRAHGILARRPEVPDFLRRGNPDLRILAFGKWGTYKRLELMLEAFNLIVARLPEAKLVIAGGDHPHATGYTESIKRQCIGNARIEFRGYVAEDALPDLFQSSSVAVMPYSSSTGCSGVAHLACAYGVPVVSADLPDFRQMAQGEELAIEFYSAGDAQGLADCLVQLLQNSEKQRSMAMQNFSAALRMTMPNVVQKYLRHFELQQRVQTLRYVSCFRRLPRWIPSKGFLLRFMTRNSLGWARRYSVLHNSWTSPDDLRLLHGDGNGRGKLNSAGITIYGDGIDIGTARPAAAISAAGRAADNHGHQNTGPQNGDARALDLSDQSQSKQSKTEPPDGEKSVVPLAVILGNNAVAGNGKGGADIAGPGSHGNGREGTVQDLGQAGAGQSNGIVEGA